MTNCLRKTCSFGLLCMSFVNVDQFVCASFSFDCEDGSWDSIVLAPDHCLSFYFTKKKPFAMACLLSWWTTKSYRKGINSTNFS